MSVDGGRSQFTIDPATGRFTGVVEHKSAESKLPEGTESMSVTVTEEWTDQRPS